MGGGRKGRGGASPLPVFERVLRCHIQSCRHKYTTVDDIVSYLRSSFPEYGRKQLQPFTRTVERTLERLKSKDMKLSSGGGPSTPRLALIDADDGIENGPARKKKKRIEASEERLQSFENQHLRRTQKGFDRDGDGKGDSNSSSESNWTDDKTDGAVSTSEDAVYEEKYEPEFDLMKSMLRHSYSKSDAGRKVKTDSVVEDKMEKNVEVEIVNNKTTKKVDLLGGDGNPGRVDAKGLSYGDVGDENVRGKDGPFFRDLGGMDGVLEELKMEVIVPLYHPQLPRWLGVRPMAGILLHGPPGCGKTKLAHAIANETGVPFYKISATELVSGVSGTDYIV